jgi:hypothetical protein
VCHTKTFHVPPCACQITSRHHSMLSCQHMNHSEQRSACGLYFLSQRGDIPVMLPSCSSLLVLEVLGQTLGSSFWGEAPEHLSARSGSPHPGLSETWVSVPSRIGPLCCSMRFSNLALLCFSKAALLLPKREGGFWVLFGLSVCLASLGCFESGLGRSLWSYPGPVSLH